MNKILSSLIAVFLIQSVYSQNSTLKFPKGIYQSFDHFKEKIPSDTISNFRIKIGNDTISHRFYNTKTDKRLKKHFAFSDGSNLYVNVKGMMKNFEREDKSQLKDDGNYHLKAKLIGHKYIYFEDYFTSSGAAFWGGVIAASIARRIKGVLYNYETNTFNLFKNAADFEKFVSENHPQYLELLESTVIKYKTAKRKKSVEDIEIIRKVIHDVYDLNFPKGK